jgi:hypothetical protein
MEDKLENTEDNIANDNEPSGTHIQFDHPENLIDNESIALQEEKKMREKVNEIEEALNSLNKTIEKGVKNQGENMDPEGWSVFTWNAERVSPEELISPIQIRTRESMDVDEPDESGEIDFIPPKEGEDGILKIHKKEWSARGEIAVSSMDKEGFTDIKLNPDSANKIEPVNLEEIAEFIKEVAEGKHHIRAFGQSGPINTPMPTAVVIYSQVPKSISP